MDMIGRMFGSRKTKTGVGTKAGRGIANTTADAKPTDPAREVSAMLAVQHMAQLLANLRREDRELLLIAAQRMAKP